MFWNTLVELCNNKGVSPNFVAKELGITSGTVTSWKKGGIPRDTTLRKIADYFGVSVAYLLDVVDDPDPKALHDPDKKDPHLRYKLMETLGELTEEELSQVEHYLNFLLLPKRNEKLLNLAKSS
jgi:transcriptional regulator with XRE-family HTH domain